MTREVEVHVPDIGDFEAVDVVEILVAPGDRVAVEDPLVSLESDKATMEVPSPVAGEVLAVKVALGDAVSEGSLLVVVAAAEMPDAPAAEPAPAVETPAAPAEAAVSSPPLARFAHPAPEATPVSTAPPMPAPTLVPEPGVDRPVRAHAGPGVRRHARELGVDLAGVAGSGPHGRVLEADLKQHVRETFESGGARGAAVVAGFERSADVTDLEAWRRRIPTPKGEAVPPTVAVVLKAALAALRAFPELVEPGSVAAPLVVAVDPGEETAGDGPAIVAHADVLGVREIARAIGSDAPGEAGAEPRFRLTRVAGRGGRRLQPARSARERFALAIGPVEVVPRWTGSPDDAFDADSTAGFEPRLSIPIAIDVAPDVTPDVADRFLDHWAEILSAPARLLL